MFFVVSAAALGAVMWREQKENAQIAAQAEAERRALAERSAQQARAAEEEERRRFFAMTDREHLAAAREAVRLRDRPTAQRHIAAVSSDPGASREATRIGDSLAWQELQAERETERRQALSAIEGRDSFCRNLESDLIHDGFEVESVRAEGTTLRITYILCGRVWVTRQFEGRREELRRLGFTRIDCRSGHRRGGATWDL